MNENRASNQVGEVPVDMIQGQKYVNALKKIASYLTNELCARENIKRKLYILWLTEGWRWM